jgi:hypothetical protein
MPVAASRIAGLTFLRRGICIDEAQAGEATAAADADGPRAPNMARKKAIPVATDWTPNNRKLVDIVIELALRLVFDDDIDSLIFGLDVG